MKLYGQDCGFCGRRFKKSIHVHLRSCKGKNEIEATGGR